MQEESGLHSPSSGSDLEVLTQSQAERDYSSISEVVPRHQVIQELLDFGMSPDIVAAALKVSVSSVHAVVNFGKPDLTVEDKELADVTRRLAHRAAAEAFYYLDYGTTDIKLSIIRSVLSAATRVIGKEQSSAQMETRAALESLFTQMREPVPDATPTGPTTLPTDDPR